MIPAVGKLKAPTFNYLTIKDLIAKDLILTWLQPSVILLLFNMHYSLQFLFKYVNQTNKLRCRQARYRHDSLITGYRSVCFHCYFVDYSR